MIIDLAKAADVAFTDDERPIHRRIWYVLRMALWRQAWRIAKETNNHSAMDQLDRQYEFINGI